MNTAKVVYIFNMSEDVWPFIMSMSDEKARKFEIDEASHLADRELFTNINETEFVFITPEAVKESFLNYFKKVSGIQNVEVLIPANNSGRITDDILADKNLFIRLIQIGKESKKLAIKSYSSSYGIYKLLNELKKNKVNVSAPESPAEENAWTSNYFGSKTGIRQLVLKMNNKNIQMAEGIITAGLDDAAEIATHWYFEHGGVVIKTQKGHAGMGVLLFKDDSLPKNYEDCKTEILKILEKDKYWKLFPIVIEKYIDFDETVSGGFPNIEYQILENGKVQALYPCGMRVSDKGVFMGVEIHESIYTKNLTKQLVNIGNAVGKEYAKSGYIGNFELDFALGKNGKLYITESNVRKTGGTYVYEVAKKLIGKNFLKDSYILSRSIYKISEKKKYTFETLYEKISSLLYNSKTKEGVIITSANLLHQGCFGYIIFGKDKTTSVNIEKKMIELLEH